LVIYIKRSKSFSFSLLEEFSSLLLLGGSSLFLDVSSLIVFFGI